MPAHLPEHELAWINWFQVPYRNSAH